MTQETPVCECERLRDFFVTTNTPRLIFFVDFGPDG